MDRSRGVVVVVVMSDQGYADIASNPFTRVIDGKASHGRRT